MAGTIESGRKAALTNKRKYGEDMYVRIGAIGGRAPCAPNAGFRNKELAVRAGSLGGKVSRRPPVPGKPTTNRSCTYCQAVGHTAYSCELRHATIKAKASHRAALAVEREEQDMDRERLSKIAQKWSRK